MSNIVQQKIDFIGASFGFGAGHYGTAKGPLVLYQQYLALKLAEYPLFSWHYLTTEKKESPENLSFTEKLSLVSAFDKLLAKRVAKSIEDQHFPIVIGGDHAIAVGTWSGIIQALDAHEAFGLIWFDAHMDSHTPQTTPSGNIHGMPLAALLGHGSSELVEMTTSDTKLNPAHVVLIGVRSYEKEEAALLASMNVKIYYVEEVKERGLAVVFEEALNKVTSHTKGFGISLDIDVFDPTIAPGTGTPEPNGLFQEEVCLALKRARKHALYKALEIAEFNPEKETEKTLQLMESLIQCVIDG